MATTQYIGARYVPLFAEPADWNNTRVYEPLTIVLHEGNSFTSRQFVPKGIDISNEEYWANTGNYNAQVEQYRKEVLSFDTRITNADTTANDAKSLAQTNKQGIATLDSQIAGTKDSGLKTYINNVAKSKILPGKILWIGDSFSAVNEEVNYASWLKTIQSFSRLDVHAKSGAGFAGGDTTFIDLLNAVTATDYDMCIVFGGDNDAKYLPNNQLTIYNGVKTFVSNFLTKFPNTPLYIVGPNFEPDQIVSVPGNIAQFEFCVQKALSDLRHGSKNCTYISYPCQYAQVYYGNFAAWNNSHPSNDANKYMFMQEFFEALINGGVPPTPACDSAIRIPKDFNGNYIEGRMNNTRITFDGVVGSVITDGVKTVFLETQDLTISLTKLPVAFALLNVYKKETVNSIEKLTQIGTCKLILNNKERSATWSLSESIEKTTAIVIDGNWI